VEERELLEWVLNATQEKSEPTVFIEAENQDEFLNPFGVILCNYGTPRALTGPSA
jgi:transcriptional regulator of heat shock response